MLAGATIVASFGWADSIYQYCVRINLADEFTRVSEIVSRRNLLSASTTNLVVPRFQRKTLGGRAFPVAAAQAWNSLPSHVTSSSSLVSFKRNLKTELFLRSYVQAWYRLMLHVFFLTLLRALEVNIDLRHVNKIRYYYYYYYISILCKNQPLLFSKFPRRGVPREIVSRASFGTRALVFPLLAYSINIYACIPHPLIELFCPGLRRLFKTVDGWATENHRQVISSVIFHWIQIITCMQIEQNCF